MAVPAYQIQNILTLYCRKLEQAWHNEKKQTPDISVTWKINVIAQSKKERVINKVTESILSKITLMGPRRYMEQQARAESSISSRKSFSQPSSGESHMFRFSVLNEENVRVQKTIHLGNKAE